MKRKKKNLFSINLWKRETRLRSIIGQLIAFHVFRVQDFFISLFGLSMLLLTCWWVLDL